MQDKSMNAEELSIPRPRFRLVPGGEQTVTIERRRPAALAPAPGTGTPAALDDEAVLLDLATLRGGYYLGSSDVLPRKHFLRELQREKIRSDRSKTCLSVSFFQLDGNKARAERLLQIVCADKRETDLIGYLGNGCVAVLLPETDAAGAERQAQRIVSRSGVPPLSPVTHTYPDQLFEHILGEGQVLADCYPFFAPDTVESRSPAYRLKRLLDVCGALAGIVLLSPLMLATAIAVAASSPGPIVFKQTRIGRKGVPFSFYKFRSMYCNNDDRIHRDYVATLIKGDVAAANQGDGGKPLFKLKADPRVTRVGRFIRKTSLDELPQLFNVLKGDMSLVGPRPPVPYEVEKYQSWHLRRILEARPGITGLWQVEGRSKTTFDEMVRLDLRYIGKCSLWFDLKLILRTVAVVLRDEGAR
jgi:lipopolysaccharide/colanic/teichoic acid biosynthesis glycosyltransferase